MKQPLTVSTSMVGARVFTLDRFSPILIFHVDLVYSQCLMSGIELSRSVVLDQCRRSSHCVYETPELNECLFLHGLGISSVSPLFGAEYTNLVQLSLENNLLSSIGGLGRCIHLRVLNLRGNIFTEIDFEQDFGSMCDLEELNLGGNKIVSFHGGTNSLLRHLRLNKNKLRKIPILSLFTSLELLDVSENAIEELLDSDISSLPVSLKQIYLFSNPFIGEIKNYRKRIVLSLPSLVYCDKSFVTALERLGDDKDTVEAFHRQRRAELNNRVLGLYNMQPPEQEIMAKNREDVAKDDWTLG